MDCPESRPHRLALNPAPILVLERPSTHIHEEEKRPENLKSGRPIPSQPCSAWLNSTLALVWWGETYHLLH